MRICNAKFKPIYIYIYIYIYLLNKKEKRKIFILKFRTISIKFLMLIDAYENKASYLKSKIYTCIVKFLTEIEKEKNDYNNSFRFLFLSFS